jgi:S1-C subfamily serine protease
MAVVLANADGTVYHRYGGRTDVSPMNIDTLVDVMQQGLVTHRNHRAAPFNVSKSPTVKVTQLVNQQLKGVKKPTFGCVHCHYVREAKQYAAMESGNWNPEQFWIWPSPQRTGLVMRQDRQYEIQKIIPHSAAEKAGIKAGDRLVSLNDQSILTKYDIQWVLDQSSNAAVHIPFSVRRNNEEIRGNLDLETAWKVGDPENYHWRVRNIFTEHMVKFLPTPGFIGNELTGSNLEALNLSKETFNLKVNQVNRGSYLAGIRLGDVILSANGKSDFADPRSFYYWSEIQRLSGRDIQMRLIRLGNPMNLRMSLEHLNYSRVDKAPQVDVGFIIQELAGGRGLRVGHVNADSAANKTGLQIGDRIVTVDGQNVSLYDDLQDLLNKKSPGDLLLVHVDRNDQTMQFSYHLPGQDEQKNELAFLSDKITFKDQKITCTVSIRLPAGKHIYSMHHLGFGLPTTVEFRGTGYQLMGPTIEPPPHQVQGGIEPMWVHEKDVSLRQKIVITDPDLFMIQLNVYAQVCDDRHCYELRSSIYSDGSSTHFFEFTSNSENLPIADRVTNN